MPPSHHGGEEGQKQLELSMISDPITSWEIDGETVADFILGGSKITADDVEAMKLEIRVPVKY